MMRTLFISDLHLSETHPEITECFLQFITQEAIHADALYILGDLFETFIGDDENTPLHQKVAQTLSELKKKGIAIYFLHGNRDFLLGKTFAQQSQMTLIPDPTIINLYGKPTLLIHGDTLCTRDIHYLTFRKRAQNPFLQKLFLMLPIKTRRLLAAKTRELSQIHTKKSALSILDVTPEAILPFIKKHAVHQLIHGHTHQPGLDYFYQNNNIFTRITLGDWGEMGHFLSYYEDGRYRSTVFSPSRC